MKRYYKLIIIVVGILSFIVLSTCATGQSLNVSVSQDFRLLVMKDINGSDPPQPDIITSVDAYFKWVNTGVNYEYANVGMDFHRVSASAGVHYQWKFMEVKQSFNYGVIVRPFGTFGSWGTHSQLGFIWKRWKGFGLVQVTQRSEWGDMIRWSGFIGLSYKIFEFRKNNNEHIQIQ